MIIVTDTREQKPLDFKPYLAVVVVERLETGDYSVKGHEKEICVERKSIHDLVNTLYHGKKRFAAELDRMRLIPNRVIVVEGDMRDIHRHDYRSKVHPNAVMGLINHITHTTQTPVVWTGDAEMAAWWIESWFRQVLRHINKEAGIRSA